MDLRHRDEELVQRTPNHLMQTNEEILHSLEQLRKDFRVNDDHDEDDKIMTRLKCST
jgi:hypothetical protein